MRHLAIVLDAIKRRGQGERLVKLRESITETPKPPRPGKGMERLNESPLRGLGIHDLEQMRIRRGDPSYVTRNYIQHLPMQSRESSNWKYLRGLTQSANPVTETRETDPFLGLSFPILGES